MKKYQVVSIKYQDFFVQVGRLTALRTSPFQMCEWKNYLRIWIWKSKKS